MAKKKTQNQLAWEREFRRIKRTQKRAEKRGYVFDGQLTPPKPQRVTQKALREISKIRGSELYSRGQYFSPLTGQEFSGQQGYKIEKATAQQKRQLTLALKKAKETEPVRMDYKIVEEIKNELKNWRSSPAWSNYWRGVKRKDKDTIERIFYDAMARYGLKQFSEYLAQKEYESGRIMQLLEGVLYASQEMRVKNDTVELATIFNNAALNMDELKELTNHSEQGVILYA